MKFDIMTCTKEEYTKADADPTYAPNEHKVGSLIASDQSEANRMVTLLIRNGVYDRGACPVPSVNGSN